MKRRYFCTSLLTAGIATLLVTPLLFVVYSAFTIDSALWIRLWQTRLPFLFSNTFNLLLAVGLTSLVLGVSLAWIMSRYDFPGKRIWKWVVLLPFAVPGYVLAYAYATIMAPGGMFHNLWVFMGGDLPSMPSLYSFGGGLDFKLGQLSLRIPFNLHVAVKNERALRRKRPDRRSIPKEGGLERYSADGQTCHNSRVSSGFNGSPG